MRGWYGPPIAVADVPGAVWVCGDGDFRGPIAAGQFMNVVDFAVMRLKRIWKNAARRQLYRANTGFSGLSDLISEAAAGKKQDLWYAKNGTAGVLNANSTLWYVGATPAAGAAAAAAPGGTVPTSATTGALFFNNPTSPDTTHFVRADALSNIAGTLLLYDRLFSVTKAMNSTATEAVTGVPTRYQNTVAGSQDSVEGNFLIIECRTVLPATAHNWTVCLYTNHAGTASQTLPSVTGNASNIVNRLDGPLGTWWCPLATGDRGIKVLTQMQCSALVATGAIDFTIGHPIAAISIPINLLNCVTDGINTAFNLTRIFDNACLAFLEILRPSATLNQYQGSVTVVSG